MDDRLMFEKTFKNKGYSFCRNCEFAGNNYIKDDTKLLWQGYEAALSHSKKRIAELEAIARRFCEFELKTQLEESMKGSNDE